MRADKKDKRMTSATTVVLGVACCAVLAAQPAADLERLFRAHQWFELRSTVTDRSPALMRARVATAFNEPDNAVRILRDIIRSAPKSNDADEAYGMLLQIYRRSGQYRKWATLYREWLQAMPGSTRVREVATDEKELAGLPDQINGRPRRAALRHDPGDFTIPASVDGTTDDYVIDTGADVSVMTARRAKRLGLTIDSTSRQIGGSSGQLTGFHTAIAKEVVIGGIRFRNVSFAVLDGLPSAIVDAGIVGMPVLLALGTIRWSPEGAVDIDVPARPVRADANLVFDRNDLLLRMRVFGRDVLTTLDTGAQTSDLNANFADTFPEAVDGAKKGSTAITGVGGTRTFESLEIPEVSFTIGSVVAWLRPATVTLQRMSQIGGDCCVGNAGEDLLTQGFAINFSRMTLSLNPPHP